jgi:cytochrome P450
VTVSRSAPSPRRLPLLDNALEFRRGAFEMMRSGHKKYGDVFVLKIGGTQLFVISHPELAQDVLVDRARLFPKANLGLSLLLGNGLVTNTDHGSWLTQRRMMQPMFHRQRLAAFGEKMQTAGQHLLESWQQKTHIDLDQEMMKVTLEIITQTMFSTQLTEDAAMMDNLDAALHFVQRCSQQPVQLPLAWNLGSHLHFRRQKAALEGVVKKLIATRRANAPQADLLDMLLEARNAETGEGMSDQQLIEEILTIFVAGHETTAHTLTFAWFALAKHHTVRQKLDAELQAVLQGRTPTVDDLPNLPYTRQIFEETLRLYPTAPNTTPRVALENTQVGGYAVPKGALLLVSIYNIHHHNDFWDSPLEFHPERFAPERVEKHRLEFMPFGAGARKCIGNNLALMEGQLLLAQIAQKYNMVFHDTVLELEQAITLRPKNSLLVRLEKRQMPHGPCHQLK